MPATDIAASDTATSDEAVDTTETAGSTDTSGDDELVESGPASGEPILVGHIGDGTTEAIDNQSENEGVDAAVAYANEQLGGLAGRPIEIVRCETLGTPAGAQECVSQMIDAGVVAVVNGVSGQAGSFGPQLGDAGIPLVQFGGLDPAVLGATNNFIVTNGLGTALAGPAAVAAENGVTKAGVIVINVPAATGPISQIGPVFYENAGVELEIVTVDPGTADMTSPVQAAISKGVEQFAIVGDQSFCASALDALDTLGFDGEIVVIGACVADVTVDALEGHILLTSSSTDTDDPEVALYNEVMDEFAPDAVRDTTTEGGYGALISLVRATTGLQGEVTGALIAEAISTMEPAQLPVAPDGVQFQCGSGVIAFAPAICAGSVLQTVLDGEGKGTEFEELDTSAITVMD